MKIKTYVNNLDAPGVKEDKRGLPSFLKKALNYIEDGLNVSEIDDIFPYCIFVEYSASTKRCHVEIGSETETFDNYGFPVFLLRGLFTIGKCKDSMAIRIVRYDNPSFSNLGALLENLPFIIKEEVGIRDDLVDILNLKDFMRYFNSDMKPLIAMSSECFFRSYGDGKTYYSPLWGWEKYLYDDSRKTETLPSRLADGSINPRYEEFLRERGLLKSL